MVVVVVVVVVAVGVAVGVAVAVGVGVAVAVREDDVMAAPALALPETPWDLTAELARLEAELDALRAELLRCQDALTPRARSRYLADRERRGGPAP